MPHERPHRVGSRSSRRRERYRTHPYEGQQAQHHDPPVIVPLNVQAELQLHHPVANDPAAQGAEQPHVQEVPNQLAAPHHLGDMNNRCPHCASRYFQEECNTQAYSPSAVSRGK